MHYTDQHKPAKEAMSCHGHKYTSFRIHTYTNIHTLFSVHIYTLPQPTTCWAHLTLKFVDLCHLQGHLVSDHAFAVLPGSLLLHCARQQGLLFVQRLADESHLRRTWCEIWMR